MVRILKEASNTIKKECEFILGMSIREYLEEEVGDYYDLTEKNILEAYKKCKEVHTLIHSNKKIEFIGCGFGFIVTDSEDVDLIHDTVVEEWDEFDEDYGDGCKEFSATFEEAGEFGSIGYAEDQAGKPYFSVIFGEL